MIEVGISSQLDPGSLWYPRGQRLSAVSLLRTARASRCSPPDLRRTFRVGHGFFWLSSGVRDPAHLDEFVHDGVSRWVGRRRGVGRLWRAVGIEG